MEELFDYQTDLIGKMGRCYENWRKKGESKLTIEAAEIRKALLADYWRNFLENHKQILNVKTKDKSYGKHDYFTKDYYALGEEAFATNSAQFAEFISSRTRVLGESESNTQSKEASNQQLPRISLPRFGGNLTEWRNFKDLFSAIIINRSQLKDVERLHYLKTSLYDEPYQLIQNISVAEENFARAWKIIVDRYENKRILIHAHLTKLFAIKSAAKETAPELKKIYNSVIENVEALQALGCPTDSWDLILQFIILQRLDAQSRKDWETSPSIETAGFEDLKQFLQKRIRALESYAGGSPLVTKFGNSKVHAVATKSNPSQRTPSCSLCQKKHFIAYCSDFHTKSLEDKKALVKLKQLCQNCLGTHPLKNCFSSKNCRLCGLKHHTSLHEPQPTDREATINLGLEREGSKILGTATIIVRGKRGENVAIRALIDSGSEVSLVSESIVQLLGLPKRPAKLSILGVGTSSSITTRHSVQFNFSSRWSPKQTYSIDAFVLPKITSYTPAKAIQNIEWLRGMNLPLADDNLDSSQPVNALLGADIYPQIIEQGLQKSPSGTIVAQNTTLGWIIIGDLEHNTLQNQVEILHCSTDNQLLQQIQRFWEQEEVSRPTSNLSPQEMECETHYKNTHRRLEDGSYMVRLPFKGDTQSLGSTLYQAKSMLQKLENRFQRDKEFHSMYHTFLKEYVLLDHMQRMDETETPLYVLPHHGVFRASSSTTKLRVVFNASAKSSSGYALNDLLHTGPQLLPYLDDLLIRWRKHRVCFSADIEKMFRCIKLHPDDQPYQVILWREHPNQPIEFYKLKTVTYGMSCSPYLASRTLHQLADDEQETFPLGSNILKTDAYVDDILSGADTLEEGLKAQAELLNLLKKAKFNLRKWTSNQRELLEHLPPELVESSLSWQPSEFSVLGLHWDSDRDTFYLKFAPKPEEGYLSKRTVLRQIAQLFDPLGFFAPVIVSAKIFMQSLWFTGLDWDDPLTTEDATKWKSYYSSLSSLSSKGIPRWIGFTNSSVCQLHAFADASTKAYGAAVYLRSQSIDGITSTLTAAKTRVAPVKMVSLPRLELCGAQLAAQLVAKIRAALKIEISAIFLWSDSTITLSWLYSHPARWKTYVANRVSVIQNLLPGANWRYVPTTENPADLASRGVTPEALIDHELWWLGPPWLRKDCTNWPVQPTTLSSVTAEERSPTVTVLQTTIPESEIITRYSSLRRLLRISAWCLKFYKKLKKLTSPEYSVLTVNDIEEAKHRLILSVQSTFFQKELNALGQNKPVSISSPLSKLNPFLDERSILRVGGRLKHSLLDFEEKHPIILPRKSHFSDLVIKDIHARTLHGGLQLTLTTVRTQYWIVNGRNAVKSIIHQCKTCIRFRGSRLYQLMGNLPKERVRPSRPFAHTGVDYCGPVMIKSHKGRKAPIYKGYICIFICFAIKAIHIELVSDYTTDSFLAAYKRFVARRGLCLTITSDRGTNFVGAANELKTLLDQLKAQDSPVQRFLADQGTTWRFNPASAPHFGGLWESSVKSVKHHLRRVIGETLLTYEEMTTLLTQIEGILNSRPLLPLTDDPEDLNVLTPNHFLIGPTVNLVPEPDLHHIPVSRLSKWQVIQNFRNSFWKQWSKEYLQQLQKRNKWKIPHRDVKVGDVVLLRNDHTPPARWPLAKVLELHPGSDGLARVATIQTTSGRLQRPIVNLVLLHTEEDQ